MNRKKIIDYTITRRSRDSYSQLNASKPRTENRDQRGRGDGDRDKKPFWTKDDKNSGFNKGNGSKYNTFQMSDKRDDTLSAHCNVHRDAVLKDLQEEISRAVLSQSDKDDLSMFGRDDKDSYSRDAVRGPIIDEFSEDAYDLYSGSTSTRMDFRDSKDQQRRKPEDSFSRKRSFSPIDDKSSSYKKSREDTSAKRSRSTNSGSHYDNDDDDLRNVLKQYQKSKWYDDEDATKDKMRYDSKDSGGKHDNKRSKESLGVSSSSDMFTMSSQGTLVSLPLEPLKDNRDYFDPGFSGDYRDRDRQKGDKQSYGDSGKDRDSRESRDYSRSRYSSRKQDRRGSLDDGLRGSDLDNIDSRYRVDNRDSSSRQDRRESFDGGPRGLSSELDLLHQYRDTSNFDNSNLSIDTLRDLSLPELAEKAGEKYRSGFELGRPFFGFGQGQQGKEQGWQDPTFGGDPKRDSIWESAGSLLDQRDKSYGDTFGRDDLSLQRDRNKTANDRLGSKLSISNVGQRDAQGNSYFKDNKNDNSKQRSNLSTGYMPSKSGPSTTNKTSVGSNSKTSTLANPKTGPKPLFPSGFMPRQVKVPFGKNAEKGGVNKSNKSPPLLPRKSGYFPRNTVGRSSESVDDKSDLGSNSNSKREVKPPTKGKFTTQNWSGLESNDKEESKENDTLESPQLLGSTRGRGGNRGRGGFQQTPFGRGGANVNNRGRGARGGRGAAFIQRGRGRGDRGRGVGNRGRGFTSRGRGFVFRGRGRGLPQPPVGTTVRNIFRRSRSLSPAKGKIRKSSRSPESPRRSRSRSRRSERRRGSRSRSRSSSYCSTCSSGSCSTCHSWRSISLDSLSGMGEKGKKKHVHHKGKVPRKEDMLKKSEKSLDKLKADIKDMEKQLGQKNIKDVSVKKPPEKKKSEHKPEQKPEQKSSKNVPKGKLDVKTTKNVPTADSKADSKTEIKSGKLKDRKGSLKNVVVKEEKSKSPLEVKKETKKTTDNSREVIFKSDKRKESPLATKKEKDLPAREIKRKESPLVIKKEKDLPTREIKRKESPLVIKKEKDFPAREIKRKESPLNIKKEKESPAREVKIVSEKKNKGDKVFDEKLGSKMKVDSLKITIDQPERKPDVIKNKNNAKEDEGIVDERKKSSKFPPGKQKKQDKEKVKSKKAKKKSKKRKHDRDSGDSGDDSVYSSISGQDEFFSSYDEKSKYMQPSYDERIVEFSSGAYDSNRITVHYAKRKATGPNNSRKLSEGDPSTTTPSRKNLITIPLPKEIDVYPRGGLPQNARGAPPPQKRGFEYPMGKGGQDDDSSDAPYSEISFTGNDSNLDWETAKFAGEFHNESALGEQDYGSSIQGSENLSQEWAPGQEEGGEYYYKEGAEGEGYEQEYYSYPQEEAWEAADQTAVVEGQEGEYQEYYEGEYPQEGVEGEAVGAEYEGQYYLGEDGLYYPVEGEVYEEYQGEYVEGGAEGEVVDPEHAAAYAEEGYVYQYAEEGAEWQQYEEGAAYQTEEGAAYQAEEGWVQGEVEGQWQEYQEGYPAAESEWNTEYTQGNEYEATGQEFPVEGAVVGQEYAVQGAASLPQEGYNAGVVYNEQLPQDQYYGESYPPGEGHRVEQQQEEAMEPIYSDEPVASKDSVKYEPVAASEDNAEEIKPLKSILKKAKPPESKGTKLVSERLAQLKKQPLSTPWPGSNSASSPQSVEKTEQNPGQEEAASAQSESDGYREMEEAILSSQPKDAIGTEYVVRVHGSGTANFFCKLCKCHFNTLTAKNLHIKGMKHIELYIRVKSSLLQSVIKDTKSEAPKRPADEDPSGAQKVPRRF